MTASFRAPPTILVAMLLAAALCARAAAGEAEARQGLWRDCLSRNFDLHVALTGRDLAADAAFQTCRVAETAYLAALIDSPLLDDDDVARVRPALAGRIRAWLVGSGG